MKLSGTCFLFLYLFSETNSIRKQLLPILSRHHYQLSTSVYSPDTCDIRVKACDPKYKYRTYDGSCNNLKHPTWGMLNSAFVRLFEPRYSDGKELPPKAVDGSELPNARAIVTSLITEKNVPDTVSLMVAQWAQLISHDFATVVPKTDKAACCADQVDLKICLPIRIPKNDAWYSKFNRTCLAMARNENTLTGDCSKDGFKTPINGVSHGLDASVLYGSDDKTAKHLREFKGGRMKMRALNDGRCFLPSEGTCYKSKICYIAGESRVNQNTQLSVLHTLIVRAHNRIADILKALHPKWSDETLFQEARRIFIAFYLHITFNEFLPFIIPESTLEAHHLRPKKSGYTRYDPTVPNAALVSFTNPIFRIFHSALQGVIMLYNYGLKPTISINLTDYMNSPQILEEDERFDELLLGLITQPMQKIDEYFTAQISKKLFALGRPYGDDLISLDIQRSRDFGTPAYTTLLHACTEKTVKRFKDLAKLWPADKVKKVASVYKSVHDIDPFIGITFEHKKPGHRFSPVMECLITEQFYRWKNGDRFWYEVANQPHSFTPNQLQEIRKVSLAFFICETSDNIVNISANAWLPPSKNNPVVPCSTLLKPDLTKF